MSTSVVNDKGIKKRRQTPERPFADPLFIVGMPRSGTKLLRGLLAQNPAVRIIRNETNFFPFLVRWVGDHGEPRTEAEFARLHEAMREAPYFANRVNTTPFSWRDWMGSCDRFDASGLFEGFARYETGTPRGCEVLLGDKSPSYIRHLDLLIEHFPDARIVHIVRDVRDYCASMRQAWGKDVRRAAYAWGRDVGAAHRVCAQRPAQCIEVHYEGILGSTATEMQRVCSFLGLEFSDAMTRLGQPVEAVGNARGQVEVVQRNFGQFSQKLTRREIRDIEALAYDAMLMMGQTPQYASRQRSMGAVENKYRRLKDGVQLILHSKDRGLAAALRFHLTHSRMVR